MMNWFRNQWLPQLAAQRLCRLAALLGFLWISGCATPRGPIDEGGVVSNGTRQPVDGEAEVLSLAAEMVETWGLVELADALAEDPSPTSVPIEAKNRRALNLLKALGAPVTDGAAGLQRWAEAEPIFRETARMPVADVADAAKQMEVWLRAAVGENLSTGYNVVSNELWPEYPRDRTLIYGHSDIRHARQLLLLLRAKGLDPDFRFVPKASAFRYREGWGGSTEGFPELSDGGHLVVAEEYDLFLTFAKPGDRERFLEIVNRYAKKDTPDETGLIYRAWWQPFYRANELVGGMQEVRLIEVRRGGYRSNIMTLVEDATWKRDALAKRFPGMDFQLQPIWVNPSFYRYMRGDFR